MAPRAAHPMPGMPYQGGMLMPSSVPVPQPLGIKVGPAGCCQRVWTDLWLLQPGTAAQHSRALSE